MAQQTVEVAPVHRTGTPLAISGTDGGFTAFSPVDPTKSYSVLEWKSPHRTAAQRTSTVNALAEDHVDLVPEIARRLARKLAPGVDLDDLIGDGRVGLMKAALTFAPERGVPFKTFAKHRIRGAMIDGLRALDPRSRHILAQYRAVEHAISFLANLLGRFPTEDEIAGSMGLDQQCWRKLRRCIQAAGYLLILDPLHRAIPLPEALPAATRDPESLAANSVLRSKIEDALRIISPRHRAVIILYHVTGWTMKEIGIKLGVNESRVSQIHKHAIAILRAQLDADRSNLQF